MSIEQRKARIDLLKLREEYAEDQRLRATVKPGTIESNAITRRQNNRIMKMQSLDCLINPRSLCN